MKRRKLEEMDFGPRADFLRLILAFVFFLFFSFVFYLDTVSRLEFTAAANARLSSKGRRLRFFSRRSSAF